MRTVTVKENSGKMREVEVIDCGPFEIEVGSPTFERLRKQKLLAPASPSLADEAGAVAVNPLETLNLAELREIAEKLGVEHKGLKKRELIEAITAAQDEQETLND